ncbi:hypothetical protein [Phaeovulum sp.]|uniref:hypothetical protein n=1 Tax=Phaeovulum sp. TaxID=2934796 RepID=UPI0039E231B6
MTKKNLVVVRAGANSLHSHWLDLPYAERNFEMLVSFFSEEAYATFVPAEGVRAVLVKGGKWDGLFKTLSDLDLDEFDYFWLPDDDIEASTGSINKIFELCQRYGLAVGQPSLSRKSYFSHFLLSRCAGFRIRYTNYVEIMVPCLNRALLRRALPYFENTMSGFGLDYIWCRWEEAGAFRSAVIDAVEVFHTRPVGKVLKSAMDATGCPKSEQEEGHLKAKFDLTRRTVPIAFAGVLDNGQPVSGRLIMALYMCRSWVKELKTFRSPREAGWGILKVARRQALRSLEMWLLWPAAAKSR